MKKIELKENVYIASFILSFKNTGVDKLILPKLPDQSLVFITTKPAIIGLLANVYTKD